MPLCYELQIYDAHPLLDDTAKHITKQHFQTSVSICGRLLYLCILYCNPVSCDTSTKKSVSHLSLSLRSGADCGRIVTFLILLGSKSSASIWGTTLSFAWAMSREGEHETKFTKSRWSLATTCVRAAFASHKRLLSILTPCAADRRSASASSRTSCVQEWNRNRFATFENYVFGTIMIQMRTTSNF